MKFLLHAFVLAMTATSLIATPSAYAGGCGGFGGFGGFGNRFGSGYAPNPYHAPIQPQHVPSHFEAAPERIDPPRQIQFRQPHAATLPPQQNRPQIPTFSRPTEAQPQFQVPTQPLGQNRTQSSGLSQNTNPVSSVDSQTLSALQILASLQGDSGPASINPATPPQTEVPQFTTAATDAAPPQPNAPAHLGSWVVNLPGDQSIVLTLNGDNTFSWDATKGTSSSNFKGDYRLQNDRLILVRAMDLQQMAGTWTVTENGFTFKLDGATNSGLAFARQ